MPATDWGWLIDPREFEQWILLNDPRYLVMNKPGLVVCHPSKHGPWSSLVGAAREYLGVARLHMPFRLDRETSGVLIFVKDAADASLLQKAVEDRRVEKTYYAVLHGELEREVLVEQPIGRDSGSRIAVKRAVHSDGKVASTHFYPVCSAGGFTLVRIGLLTGRLHQIRVHAAWLGVPVAGDKLYGPDETLFLEFIEHGFTSRLQAALPMRRQALHAAEVRFDLPDETLSFSAPFPEDLLELCARTGLDPMPPRG